MLDSRSYLCPTGSRKNRLPTLITQLRIRITLLRVRFLEISAGAVLGMGEKHYVIPVETGVEVGEGRVTIESGRREKVLRGMSLLVN